ncbi:MAG TPA: flagellar biosynthetic protein FliO [Steroidobacteraceae bacterium]|nr:flagellar biosynthetic protein FliO [Steroidobacteraceae bacterium]
MADPTLFAAPSAAAHGAAGGGVEITMTLLVVVGFLAALAWFARKMRGGFTRNGGARIQVLGAQSLGPKERAVLVRIGETDILIGVGAGSVNALHVFPVGTNTEAPAAPAPASGLPNNPDFKSLLLKALGKKDSAS